MHSYFEGPYKTRYMEHTSAAIAALVKRYRDAKGDIIHLHFEPSSHPEWWSGSDMAPHDTAAPKEGETVVMASMFNGFFGRVPAV